MSTYAAVVRVSHMGDRKVGAADFHADRDQVEAIKAAKPPDARLDFLPAELDVSGGLPLLQRPSLLKAVEGVERGDYAGIVVAYQSRLFRNVEEEEAVWRRVEAAGGEVLLALDPVDNKSVDGRMVRRIKSSINAAERERHAERFENLRAWATAAGIWQRRQTPTGYRRDAATRHLVPDDRADEVRRAFDDYPAGVTVSELAHRLGMTPSGTRQLLRNRVYLGELRVGRHVNPTAHEPLIDPLTFERVQRRLDDGRRTRPPRSDDGPALLAGLVRCASCGHVMTRGGHAKLRGYVCPGRHSGERCPHPGAITCSLLDAYVEPLALAELERLDVSARAGHGVDRAQAKLDAAEHELSAYLKAVSAADIGPKAFGDGARERHDAVERAREQLRDELALRPVLPKSATGADAYADLGVGERNQLLRALLAAVVVAPAGRGRRVPLADRVRVVAAGSDAVRLPERRGGEASGIAAIPLPDFDAPGVLRLAA